MDDGLVLSLPPTSPWQPPGFSVILKELGLRPNEIHRRSRPLCNPEGTCRVRRDLCGSDGPFWCPRLWALCGCGGHPLSMGRDVCTASPAALLP